MVSQAKGLMYIPVWVDDGVVKALVLDTGALPITESDPLTELDVTLKASDITLPVSEQTPLTYIQARLLTYYGATWQAAAIEADGSLHFHLNSQEADVEIAQASPALLQPGIAGYTGAAWKKQGMIWSYYDTYLDVDQSISDIAGTFQINLDTVPAGEVWYVKGFSLYRAVNAALSGQMQVYNGTIPIALETIDMPAIGVLYGAKNPPIMKATQYLIGRFIGATVGETCIVSAWGYKMKVDM